MNVKRNSIEADSQMCKSCKLFFAAQAYQGYCSSCYKKLELPKKEETQAKDLPTGISQKSIESKKEQQKTEASQSDRKRCFDCRRKVGLLGIECKCGFVFCNKHRMPQDHHCSYDHQDAGRKKLEKQMVKVSHDKIDGI